LRNTAVIGFSAMAFLTLGRPAKADLVTNGSFEITSLTSTGYFSQFGSGPSNVAGWTVNCAGTVAGSCIPGDPALILEVPAAGPTPFTPGQGLYGPAPSPATDPIPVSPDGGNYVAEDTEAALRTNFYQTINGLTVGREYVLSFYQAASQQQGETGATTEQWTVAFGSQTQYSSVMDNPSESFTPWNRQTMTFTATSTSQVLSFLADSPALGAPPVALLDGVSLVPAPEPSFAAFLGAGLLGLVALRRWRQRRA